MFAVPHPCYNRPCLNGGVCIDSYSGYNAYPDKWNHGFLHYLCICQAGFSGSNCEGKMRLGFSDHVQTNNAISFIYALAEKDERSASKEKKVNFFNDTGESKKRYEICLKNLKAMDKKCPNQGRFCIKCQCYFIIKGIMLCC